MIKQDLYSSMTIKNKFVTPEGREYIFNIPEGAETDKRGVYRIDDSFKSANPGLDFMYLSHDLHYRGLNKDNDYSSEAIK